MLDFRLPVVLLGALCALGCDDDSSSSNSDGSHLIDASLPDNCPDLAHGGGGDGSVVPLRDGGSTDLTSPTLDHMTNHQVLVGPGYSDVSPHQLVRSCLGILYTVAPTCDPGPHCSNNVLRVFKGDRAGTPTGFAEQDAAHAPTGQISSSAIAIDGADHIHVLWIDWAAQQTLYAVFDASTDTWGTPEVVEATHWVGIIQGDEGVAIALDANAVPHAAWNFAGSDRLHIHYANRQSGTFASPMQADDDGQGGFDADHPTLAFTPTGDLVLSWLDGDSSSEDQNGSIWVRQRSGGSWGSSVKIPDNAMSGQDNGPSLLVTPDGVQHVTFCDYNNDIRYWYNAGSGWKGDQQPAAQQTHNPSLGPDGSGGVFIYGHGTPVGGLAGHGDNLYSLHKGAGSSTWGDWTLYTTGGFDCSVSTRWAQFFQRFSDTIDIAYWADPYPNILYIGTN